jgi:hypothetical protein
MSHLPDDTDGLDAARALYGGPDSGEADAAAREDALFEAWARGYRTGLRDGKERAPAVLDTDTAPAGGPQT